MDSLKDSAHSRLVETLYYGLGSIIMHALEDGDVTEIMLNPDGKLWIEKNGSMCHAGALSFNDAAVTLSLVAESLGRIVNEDNPVVEGILPDGSRFEGIYPRCVDAPSFSIRKRANRIFTLEDYVRSSIISESIADALRAAVEQRKNILIVGGTGSGKTTLVNAIIHAMSQQCPDDRISIMEDTPELQCASLNRIMMLTQANTPMRELLRVNMRMRPDRILVGEVRDGAALDLIKAWNTGHPGGCSTVHANSAYGGLLRLEQLIAESSQSSMQTLIGEAIDLVVFIERVASPQRRKVTEVALVRGFHKTQQDYEMEFLCAKESSL